jgi:hypothetical protein
MTKAAYRRAILAHQLAQLDDQVRRMHLMAENSSEQHEGTCYQLALVEAALLIISGSSRSGDPSPPSAA